MYKKKHFFLLFLCSVNLVAIPPRHIPDKLYGEFTMNGFVEVQEWYINSTVSKEKNIFYKKETVLDLLEKVKQHKTFYYGSTDTWLYQALEKYNIKDQQVVIFGSVQPIYESICLHYGGNPITVEYNKWTTDHPDLCCMTPAEYDEAPILFDAGFSISSFEHDGLGRYGDPINPWGDIEAMKKAKKMIKPNGLFFLAVPMGKDYLIWNAHRIYGKKRLPLLLEGWEVVDYFGIRDFNDPLFNNTKPEHIQPVLVLRNIPNFN